jgi:hypothetical protein
MVSRGFRSELNRGIAMCNSNTSLALTRTLAAAVLLFAALIAAPAWPQDKAAATPEPGKEAVRLQENAPDRYVVVRGDTLWSISGKFLKDPWRWPEVWHMNQDQIHSPHRIYPGNIIILDTSHGEPQLKLGIAIQTEKLDPRVRIEKTGIEIPSIPPGAIEPFLSQPLVVGKNDLEAAPRIVATQEDRVNLGSGNTAYVTGIAGSKQALWHIFRPGRTLLDPESGEILGYEAVYLGTARILHDGNPATIEIVSTTQEIGRGDRMVPAASALPLSYVPHAPDNFVRGRVITTYGDFSEAGTNSIIVINRGARDGMEIGHVLAAYRFGKYFDDVSPTRSNQPAPKPSPAEESYNYSSGRGPAPTTRDTGGKKTRLKLPDERYGLVFVFRVFDRVSYALVMNVSRPVLAKDVVQSP